MMIVFYSTKSGNTRRFVERLGLPFLAIEENTVVKVDQPFILITPTYSGKVPEPVVSFLNESENRQNLLGVVNSGNMNFGADYGAAGRKIASKCNVPLLHVFELTGHLEDIEIVKRKVSKIWNSHTRNYMAMR
jgi:protein involved in ribonucleotide reduction